LIPHYLLNHLSIIYETILTITPSRCVSRYRLRLINNTITYLNMKLTNYNRGYQSWCDCVIHGTIYLSKKDFESTLFKEFDNGYTDIHTNNRIACLGVTATRKLFGHLPKFKRANYMITSI